MPELALRGKDVLITGGNVVNNIRLLYPELFVYRSMQEVRLYFTKEIQIV